jgi:hypothetical protein
MTEAQTIVELFDLAEMTRDLARTIDDPAISRELEVAAARVDELARAEARLIGLPSGSSVIRLS